MGQHFRVGKITAHEFRGMGVLGYLERLKVRKVKFELGLVKDLHR